MYSIAASVSLRQSVSAGSAVDACTGLLLVISQFR
jgi:hypothetical protein